jgi:hypothetical protein
MMDRNVARNNRPAGYIHETSAETPDPDRKRNKQRHIQLRTCTYRVWFSRKTKIHRSEKSKLLYRVVLNVILAK